MERLVQIRLVVANASLTLWALSVIDALKVTFRTLTVTIGHVPKISLNVGAAVKNVLIQTGFVMETMIVMTILMKIIGIATIEHN